MRDKKKDGAIVLTDRERLLGRPTILSQTVVKLLNLGGFLPKPVGFNSSCSLAMPAGTWATKILCLLLGAEMDFYF